jgi:hypothetical protein
MSFYVSRTYELKSHIYARIHTFCIMLEEFFWELIKRFKMKVDMAGNKLPPTIFGLYFQFELCDVQFGCWGNINGMYARVLDRMSV